MIKRAGQARRIGLIAGVYFLALCWPGTLHAQTRYWGVSASFIPSWQAGDHLRASYAAQDMDLAGRELRIGFVRGRLSAADWGISFVRKTVRAGGRLDRDDVRYMLTDGATMNGVAFHAFPIVHRVGERVQIGALLAAGVARVSGAARFEFLPSDGEVHDAKANEPLRPFGRVLRAGGKDLPLHPLVDVQLGVAVLLTESFKIRFGTGLDYPGLAVFTMTAVYLFNQ